MLHPVLSLPVFASAMFLATEPPAEQVPAAEESASLKDLAFMAGAWQAEWNGSHVEEHFTAPRNGTMMGMFRWMSDGATSMTEHMTFEQHDDGVHFYLRHFNSGSSIWVQEADGPMHFTLATVDGARAVFEDPTRAFPRTITYHRTQPDQLVVRLDGHRENGEVRQMQFDFRSTSMTTKTSTDTLNEAGQSLGYNGGLTLAFNVKDITKSLDWYQNVLGFKVLYHLEEMGWAELSTATARVNVGISQVENPKVGGPTPTFGVNDIDHARARLEEQGVKFDGPTQEIPGMVKLATFFDPDGNSLMLFQSLEETPG